MSAFAVLFHYEEDDVYALFFLTEQNGKTCNLQRTTKVAQKATQGAVSGKIGVFFLSLSFLCFCPSLTLSPPLPHLFMFFAVVAAFSSEFEKRSNGLSLFTALYSLYFSFQMAIVFFLPTFFLKVIIITRGLTRPAFSLSFLLRARQRVPLSRFHCSAVAPAVSPLFPSPPPPR